MTIDGQNLWAKYDGLLAPYAQKNAQSRGREHPHVPDPHRLPYQRDRERIIYSTAFRRLRGKMQVVSPDAGDHVRNRLTHSMEVATLARSIARELALNEDLCEVIALAHDMGHPPYGHAGEVTLSAKMKEYGKEFAHNDHSIRTVTLYERRYVHHQGLNLSEEVLMGMAKHHASFTLHDEDVEREVRYPHMEMQVVDMADEIAYMSADLEDALQGGYIDLQSVEDMSVLKEVFYGKDMRRMDAKYIAGMVAHHFITLFVRESQERINTRGIVSIDDVQEAEYYIADFSENTKKQFLALKSFLHKEYYENEKVLVAVEAGQKMIGDVFDHLVLHPSLIPKNFNPTVKDPVERSCDFIAGMTDAYLRSLWQDQVDKMTVTG